jgi:hypothetical protein
VAQLPEIKLTCRNEHSFTSRAKGGVSVSCPVCRKAGTRVQVWVSRNRPRTEREAERADRADIPAAGSELADRWEQEAPWDNRLAMLPGRPEDKCGRCGGSLQWESGRTLARCETCERIALPAAITEHYRRQEQRTARAAVRITPDQREDQARRVKIRALAQRITDRVNEGMDDFDPDGLSGNAHRLALDYRAELSAWLPEIRRAGESGDEAELSGIVAAIKGIVDRARTSGARAEIERQREAIATAAELAGREPGAIAADALGQLLALPPGEHDYLGTFHAELPDGADVAALASLIGGRPDLWAELDDDGMSLNVWLADAEPEPEPEPDAESAAAQAGLALAPDLTGVAAAAAMLTRTIERSRAARERKLAEYEPCGYEHKKPVAAERRYFICNLDGQGNPTIYPALNSESVAVCRKHYAPAYEWIREQAAIMARRNPRIEAVYKELT